MAKRLHAAEDTERTLEEVGAMMGLTRERIRQIEKAALAKVKAALEAKGIDEQLWLDHLADLKKRERTMYVVRESDPRGSDEPANETR